jgi:hypothetical protein
VSNFGVWRHKKLGFERGKGGGIAIHRRFFVGEGARKLREIRRRNGRKRVCYELVRVLEFGWR